MRTRMIRTLRAMILVEGRRAQLHAALGDDADDVVMAAFHRGSALTARRNVELLRNALAQVECLPGDSDQVVLDEPPAVDVATARPQAAAGRRRGLRIR